MPTPFDNTIDSREVIAEINGLEAQISFLEDDINEAQDQIDELESEQENLDMDDLEDCNRHSDIATEIDEHESVISSAEAEIVDFKSELGALTDLQNAAAPYCPDWQRGTTLIADDYFEDYAYEHAKNVGAVNDDMSWPCSCIDWAKAADALQMDYTSIDFDGETFWVRS